MKNVMLHVTVFAEVRDDAILEELYLDMPIDQVRVREGTYHGYRTVAQQIEGYRTEAVEPWVEASHDS